MTNKSNLALNATLSATGLIAENNVKPSTLFSVEQFFGDRTGGGYMTSDEMMSYLQTVKQTSNGMAYLNILFSNLAKGYKMTSPMLLRKDKWKNTYVWMTFNPGEPTKIILEFGMEQFIKDILENKINPNFNLQELANETDRLLGLKA